MIEEGRIQRATTGPTAKNQLSFHSAAAHHGQESLHCCHPCIPEF
jgi:hypothetical protein